MFCHGPRPFRRSGPRAGPARECRAVRADGQGAYAMSRYVMFCHAPPLRRPFLHRVSFPQRSRRPGRARGPCFARIVRGRARASAPAQFARLIARTREPGAGRTSPVRSVSPHFSPGSWPARRCRAGRVGEPRRAMRGIGQTARRTLSARQRRPSGRAQASVRCVAGLNRRLCYAFRPTPCGANAWTATQAVTPVRNAG